MRAQETSYSCGICQHLHITFKCPDLKAQTVCQRQSTVRSKQLCFNCLGPDHTCAQCTSKKLCKECHKKHHTLLHLPAVVTTPSNAASATAPAPAVSITPMAIQTQPALRIQFENPQSVLLASALVTVTHDRMQSTTGQFWIQVLPSR